jgi:hypothetical protein
MKDGDELMPGCLWLRHLWWDETVDKPQAAKKRGKQYTPRCPLCHARLRKDGRCPKHGYGALR